MTQLILVDLEDRTLRASLGNAFEFRSHMGVGPHFQLAVVHSLYLILWQKIDKENNKKIFWRRETQLIFDELRVSSNLIENVRLLDPES